ncbi:glycosyltransferase family 4 protein [Actinocorallia longicatena]|uniref:Glycosyltransferase family 4 protein n=1 Tax=Actinocorallia longicatena TaxID=111803 RepID=A0ABP6QAB1_9ACTN
MRIAVLVNQYPPNVTAGLGRYAELITPHLARDHELTVFTLNDGGLPRYRRADGVGVFRPRLPLLGRITGRRRLNRTRGREFLLLTAGVLASNLHYVRWLRRGRRPDLVAVHDSTNFLAALLCHHLLRLPLVLHVHTTEYGVADERTVPDPLGLFAALERWLARVSRRVVVATPEVRDQLLAAGWTRTPIDVVCLGGTYEEVLADPGFDRDALAGAAADLRERLGLTGGGPVLLFVGRIERQKGVYQLLDALPKIVAAHPGLRLVIVGEGDAEGVARIAAGHGVAENVLASGAFVGGPELRAHYAMADLCVFPSLFEPFGLVATEAMALGRPVVLGDGFSRIFEGDPDEPAALYVRGSDPGDIADVLTRALADPGLRAELGARGERLVGERLSWARAAALTTEAYRAALAGERP